MRTRISRRWARNDGSGAGWIGEFRSTRPVDWGILLINPLTGSQFGVTGQVPLASSPVGVVEWEVLLSPMGVVEWEVLLSPMDVVGSTSVLKPVPVVCGDYIPVTGI